MKRTAKEGVRRGKHRVAHQKVAPSEGMTSSNSAGHKKSKRSRTQPGNTLDDIVENVPKGRLPPLVPRVKISPQKSNDLELHERQGEGKRKPAVELEDAGLKSLSVVKDNSAPRAPSPTTRRRNENMTSYERMLQREKRKSRKINGSYTILHSETEDQDQDNCRDSVDDCVQILTVLEDETNVSLSNTSLQSRRSSGTPSRQGPNQALLQYFAKLTRSVDVDDPLDLKYIQSLLHKGASINSSDRFGQTLLHEVSRTWGVDVAQFFVDQGKANNKL